MSSHMVWYENEQKYNKFSYPYQGDSDQQRSAARKTHSHLMKWPIEK